MVSRRGELIFARKRKRVKKKKWGCFSRFLGVFLRFGVCVFSRFGGVFSSLEGDFVFWGVFLRCAAIYSARSAIFCFSFPFRFS